VDAPPSNDRSSKEKEDDEDEDDVTTIPARTFGTIFQICPNLTEVHLVDCDIDSMTAQKLSKDLTRTSSIKVLSIEGNSIGNIGVEYVAKALKQPKQQQQQQQQSEKSKTTKRKNNSGSDNKCRLQALDIERVGCSMKDGLTSLALALKDNDTLECLSCGGNSGFDDETVHVDVVVNDDDDDDAYNTLILPNYISTNPTCEKDNNDIKVPNMETTTNLSASVLRWIPAIIIFTSAALMTLSNHPCPSIASSSRLDNRSRPTTQTIPKKTILFLHGVGGHADEYDDIMHYLKMKYGDGAPLLHSIDLCEGSCSIFTNMIQQRDDMTTYLRSHIEDFKLSNGYHWIAHSQGSVLARAVIQNLDLPVDETDQQHYNDSSDSQSVLRPPDTFVSMAGPQMGQWGNCSMSRTDIPEKILKTMTRSLGWVVFYNELAQHELSIASYWHDPNHRSRMIEEATLLPILNGYVASSNNDDAMTKAKLNFLRIRKAVFVGSAHDDCINPPLSSVFQFLDGDENPVAFNDTMEYQNDTFGLKTMMEQGRLFVQDYPGIHHLDWRTPAVFEKYVLPHLLVDGEEDNVDDQS